MRVRTSLIGLSVVSIAAFFGCANGAPVPGYENLGGEGQGGDGSGAGTSATTSNGSTTSSSSTTSNSTSSTSTSSTSTSSTTSTTASTGTGGLMCNDTGVEPNESESTAVDLGTISDADGDGDTFAGLLEGQSDKDWYKYKGTDNFGSVVDATRTVSSSDVIRICKFAQCVSGTTEVTCPSSATDATSPDGRPGCCSDHGFTFGDLNCTGTSSDDAEIYIRLDTQVHDCVTYSVDYHY